LVLDPSNDRATQNPTTPMSASPPPPVISASIRSIFQIIEDECKTRKPGPITPGEFFGAFNHLILWIINKCESIDFSSLGTKPQVVIEVKLDHGNEIQRLLAEALSIERFRGLMEGYLYGKTFNGTTNIRPYAYGWPFLSVPITDELLRSFEITLTRLNLA